MIVLGEERIEADLGKLRWLLQASAGRETIGKSKEKEKKGEKKEKKGEKNER